jgi:hypothetical protein
MEKLSSFQLSILWSALNMMHEDGNFIEDSDQAQFDDLITKVEEEAELRGLAPLSDPFNEEIFDFH